jgi:hypothetical protein
VLVRSIRELEEADPAGGAAAELDDDARVGELARMMLAYLGQPSLEARSGRVEFFDIWE